MDLDFNLFFLGLESGLSRSEVTLDRGVLCTIKSTKLVSMFLFACSYKDCKIQRAWVASAFGPSI